MGKLWELIEQHRWAQPRPPSDRQIAAELGLAPNTLVSWRDPRRPPHPANLRRLAALLGQPEGVVIRAALVDTGYWPAEDPEVADPGSAPGGRVEDRRP